MSKTKTTASSVAPATEGLLEEQETALSTREAELDERETALNLREAKLNEREAELNGREAALETAKLVAPVQYDQPGEAFKFNGEAYEFTPAAPKLIRINGEVKTQKEITKDKGLLLQLVAGNSSLITKK